MKVVDLKCLWYCVLTTATDFFDTDKYRLTSVVKVHFVFCFMDLLLNPYSEIPPGRIATPKNHKHSC